MVDNKETDGHLGKHKKDGNESKVLPISKDWPPTELSSNKVLTGILN